MSAWTRAHEALFSAPRIPTSEEAAYWDGVRAAFETDPRDLRLAAELAGDTWDVGRVEDGNPAHRAAAALSRGPNWLPVRSQ